MTMLEEMAHAVREQMRKDLGRASIPWDQEHPAVKAGACGLVVAALKVLRNPTEEMLEVLRKQGGIDGFQAMIDVVLKEKAA